MMKSRANRVGWKSVLRRVAGWVTVGVGLGCAEVDGERDAAQDAVAVATSGFVCAPERGGDTVCTGEAGTFRLDDLVLLGCAQGAEELRCESSRWRWEPGDPSAVTGSPASIRCDGDRVISYASAGTVVSPRACTAAPRAATEKGHSKQIDIVSWSW